MTWADDKLAANIPEASQHLSVCQGRWLKQPFEGSRRLLGGTNRYTNIRNRVREEGN